MSRTDKALLALLKARNNHARASFKLKASETASNARNLRRAWLALKAAEKHYEEVK